MIKHIPYRPLTATPFKKNAFYTELAPDSCLQSYIRCFWGTERPIVQSAGDHASTIVIPDTCVDIIYCIDYTDNTVTGGFCGVNDHSFYTHGGRQGHLISMFAIRFYAWSAHVFAEDSFKSTLNEYSDAASRFGSLDKVLRPILSDLITLQEKVAYTEKLMISKARNVAGNRIIENAVNNILMHRGTLEISNLAKECFVCSRQLERLFHEYIGITPKKLSNLIRYQSLWKDVLCEPDFNILNAVDRYGFTDQAHLLHEFKRYHSMDIRSAKLMAYGNVENIQEKRVSFR